MDLHKLFNKTVEFKDCNLSVYEPGHVVLTTPVNVTNLNPYENAHGGYLFTLCDSTAGAVAYSLGSYVVTLQASINYMKAAHLGEVINVAGTCSHDGRTTKVINVDVTNEKGQQVVQATYTMYVTGPAPEQPQQ